MNIGVNRSRLRIGGASRSHLRLSPNPEKGKLDPMVTASTPGTVRSRSTSARCDLSPSRFVVPCQTRIDLYEHSSVEAKPWIGRRGRDRAHQEQPTGREQEKRERDLTDHQRIADPAASGLPSSVLAERVA